MDTATQAGGPARLDTATLAGGCFWCTEAIFQRLKGVASVTPGYTGGKKVNPTYDEVCTGITGHAEAIQITFDSTIINYETLLTIFFHLHDPTTLNRQGNDVGTQYRSAIFYHDDKQKEIAEKVKTEVEKSGTLKGTIVTEIVPATEFYNAEESHRDYYNKNSYKPYCQYIIDPKIQKLLAEYRQHAK